MKRKISCLFGSLFSAVLVLSAGRCWGQSGSLNSIPAATSKPPSKANVAVITIKNTSGVTAGETEVISDRLRDELFTTGKVNVMERDQMQEVLKEQGFQQSGACNNEQCMVEMGQMLGVQQLITGSLGKIGSMFLVNLRVIDVKTATIVKVVEVDVKGELEDLVTKLPDIANQLVGVQPVASRPPSPETPEKEKPVETEGENVDTAAGRQRTSVQPMVDERAEKNKNRSGIRMEFNVYGNGIVAKRQVTHYNAAGIDTGTEVYNFPDSLFTYSPLLNPQLKFFFKAGPFITIDVGPSYSYQAIESKDTNGYQYGDYVNVFGVATGVNFVNRWYPVKMNVGLMFDFNYLLNMEEYKFTELPYSYVGNSDSLAFHDGANASIGLRAGAEIMAGKHFGFNLDLLYQYSYFETVADQETYVGGTSDNSYFSYLLPMLGIGFGVNFYY